MSYESRLFEIRSDTFAGLLMSKAPTRIKEIDRMRERGERREKARKGRRSRNRSSHREIEIERKRARKG